MKDYEHKETCASCGSTKLSTILDLNNVPLAGYFPSKEELENLSSYPLKLQICECCKLAQTDSVINPDILFRDYRYLSSIGLSKHFEQVAKNLHDKYDIKDKDILEFGSNDGVLLKPLKELGAKAIGVDPSINVSQIARDKGLDVITEYFNFDTFGGEEWRGKFDFVLSNNSFAHITDIRNTVKAIEHCLKDGGKFIFEVHYLDNLVNDFQWDNIYHEHIYYYSVTALQNLLKQFNLSIIDVEKIPIHSGSIRVTAHKNPNTSQKVQDIIEKERTTICDTKYLNNFQENVTNHISEIKKEIDGAQEMGLSIAGYGASGRANMACNILGLDSDTIEFIVDESPERCGRYIANTKIPIVDVDTLKNSDIDILIIFAWNYADMIMEKTKFKNYTYMVAFPTVKYLKNEA
tara:strand:- start:1716 stop:2933 length:1218 start_codon:yes stop_codon:yes gene_type:complete